MAGFRQDAFLQQEQHEQPFGNRFRTGGLFPQNSRSWHHRPRSPGLRWHKGYNTPESLKSGRVLLIDYVKQDHSKQDMRKVAAQELSNMDELRRVYSNQDRNGEATLRVFHVQNADWATHFLLRKFNITSTDDLVGTDFGQFVKQKCSRRQGGKPFLSGKTWKTTRDPWRGISRASFGIDYLKHYRAADASQPHADVDGKFMQLNCFGDDDNVENCLDVYTQRLSCYIQHNENAVEVPNSPDIDNPYIEQNTPWSSHENRPHLQSLDNGNAIIIFESSHTGSIEDTLIGARQQWESRWRRLPFYLALEREDIMDDDLMSMDCMKLIMGDVWKSIAENWENFLNACNDHVSILEDKIYEGPADETRAPELWTNSSMWLKVERLVWIHIAVLKEMQLHLRDLAGELAIEDNWLESSTGDFERLSNLVQEDLIKPTANLADLMYKSVEIRDSRHSLQLNASLWRLSWITFIFLPLTFMVGFFGMNVDTFRDDPSIKWYFLTAVPMMLLVFILWFTTKNFLARQRQTPYQRGIYENLFHNLSTTYPELWSRSGPLPSARPLGFLNRLKWRLVLYWNTPEKTIRAGPLGEDSEYDGLGAWSRLKRTLSRRWTSDILGLDSSSDSMIAGSIEDGTNHPGDIIRDGVGDVTELLALPIIDHADNRPGSTRRSQRLLPSRTKPQSASSPEPSLDQPNSKDNSGKRNSGVMVEEEKPTWLYDFRQKNLRLPEWIGGPKSPRSESRNDGTRQPSAGSPPAVEGHQDDVARDDHEDSRRMSV